jgi:hypothetical protein
MNMMTPEEYKKWYESTTDKQRMESDARIAKMEFEQENPIKPKKKPKRDTVIPGKGGKGNYAKGGEVKGYMGGGSVHKNKNKMLTTKGWGASRKT